MSNRKEVSGGDREKAIQELGGKVGELYFGRQRRSDRSPEKRIHSAFPRINHLNQTDFYLVLTWTPISKDEQKNKAVLSISHISRCNSFSR